MTHQQTCAGQAFAALSPSVPSPSVIREPAHTHTPVELIDFLATLYGLWCTPMCDEHAICAVRTAVVSGRCPSGHACVSCCCGARARQFVISGTRRVCRTHNSAHVTGHTAARSESRPKSGVAGNSAGAVHRHCLVRPGVSSLLLTCSTVLVFPPRARGSLAS